MNRDKLLSKLIIFCHYIKSTQSTASTANTLTTPDPGTVEWEVGSAHLTPNLTCSNSSSMGLDRKKRYAVKGKKNKIVGGSIVPDRSYWPWIVRLNMGCGGSIIHPGKIKNFLKLTRLTFLRQTVALSQHATLKPDFH